ncbi:MAG: hypothetical protein R3A52_04485 [Polyangiales bacterium]
MRAALALMLALAPLQCPSRRPPDLAREETPGEALWALERFAAAGDVASQRETLRFLVERYPSSRFAPRAGTRSETPGSVDERS